MYYNYNYIKYVEESDDIEGIDSFERNPLEYFLDKIHVILHIIENDPVDQLEYLTSFGDTLQPMGVGRFKLIEVMSNLLKCKNERVNEEIAKTNFYTIILVI